MNRHTLKISALALFSTLLVGCAGTDITSATTDNSTGSTTVLNETPSATEASTEASASASTEVENTENADTGSKGEFSSIVLETGKECSVDLGNDGNNDTLLLSHGSSDYSDGYSITANGNSFDILSEKDTSLCETVDVTYVKNGSGDYLLVNREGFSCLADVKLYKWVNQTFKEIDSIENINFLEDADGITADHVVLYDNNSPFGSWYFCKDYSYGENGFSTSDKLCKIRPGYGCPGVLTLNKSLTFNDENGNPTTTLDAGQNIIPYEGTNDYQIGTPNTMSFTSEDGKFLGYITYEYVKDEASGYPIVVVDGVNEDDLFSNLVKAG